MNEIERAVQGFIGVTECSLEMLYGISMDFDNVEREEYFNDWLQANWELIVEKAICKPGEYLQPYGEGADCNGASSRICFPKAKPTHFLRCANRLGEVRDLLSGRIVDVSKLDFHSFQNCAENTYSLKLPLNAVLFEGDTGSYLTSLKEVAFELNKL